MPDDPDGAGVCEVGICDMRIANAGEISIEAPRSILCNPGKPIKPEARAVHHIRDSEIMFTRPAAEVLESVLSDKPDYVAAHNAKFEQAFITTPIPWICSYKVALRLWPDSPSHALQVLRYWLPIDVPDEAAAAPAHRAGPDAYMGALLLAKAIEHGGATIEDMVRWSAGPPLLHKVSFGKHRGSLWKDLPRDYLEWIFFKSDMDSDTKANARYRLKERGWL